MKKYARIKSTGDIRQVHAIDFPNESEFIDDELELNDNQKIVLEWLESKGSNYTNIFYLFEDLLLLQIVPEEVAEAFKNMMINKKEQLEVVKAFAEWGLEQWQTTDTGE